MGEDIQSVPTRLAAFDYDRTVVAFHGTNRRIAESLIAGEPFNASTNDDDWLGHGIYFWEYAPQQAWWWAERRYKDKAAVVGALIRLGQCLDLLDPANVEFLTEAHKALESDHQRLGTPMPSNMRSRKKLDCAVFNYLFKTVEPGIVRFESVRAVFVPGRARVWKQSGVFLAAHIQLSVREPNNILAVWPVKKDGRYGKSW